MESRIKTATIENLEEIQKLNLLLFQKEHKEFDQTLDCDWVFSKRGEAYFRDRITGNDSCVFLAYVNESVVGYLAGGLTEKSEYRILPVYAELENMFILDKHRSQGIGSDLVQSFLEWCKSKNVSRVKVVASAKNTNAITFYKKHDFADHALILESVL